MDKILLIDGHNLLFQMFFGMPNKIINKDGKEIRGTLGFIGAMLKIIKLVNPTHILVVFDGEKREVRTEYAFYKANRIDYNEICESDNPFSQLNDIYKALEYLNIKHYETIKYEADDVIASYSIRLGKTNEIVVSSFDSDFFQLINSNVKVLRYKGDNTIICDEVYLKNKFDITPNIYPLFKSLVGDSADNIKGVKSVGVKTAALILNRYNNIENLLENIDNIEKRGLRENLKNSIEQIKLNYRLIKLNDNAPFPYEKEDLKYYNKSVSTNDILRAIGLK